MKTLLILPIFSLLSMTLVGQNRLNSYTELETHLRSSDKSIRESTHGSDIMGSPYLTENFQAGKIYWNSTWNEGIELRYDIYMGGFEAKLESGIIVIDPLKNIIDTLAYNGEVFVRKILVADKRNKLIYLPLLGQDNEISVFKQYRITVSEAVTDTDLYHEAKPAEYKTLPPVYYVFRDNENWEVKGNKTIAEIFGIEVKEVKSYLKKMKYKLSKEKDLVETVLYFSKISAES